MSVSPRRDPAPYTAAPAGVPTDAPSREGLADRVGWYARRLRSMSPGEVPSRVVEQVRRARGRGSARGTPPALPRTSTGLADAVLRRADRPDVRRHWKIQAEAVSQGRVEVFGTTWPTTVDGVPDWDLDPSGSHRWPQDYCFDVPMVLPGAPEAEVKHVWELNRLCYLLPVAAQARTTGDEGLRLLCRRHLRSWVRSNPPRRGVTWRSGIELSIRLMMMVLVLELTSGSADDDGLEPLVARSVAEQADWVRRFPSRHSSANNHRVAELVGLLVASAAYPGLGTSAEVKSWWVELDAVLIAQFHEDGVPAEQAVLYGLLVLEWAAVSGLLVRPDGLTRPAPLVRRLERAATFARDLVDAGGHPVVIGDSDDSRLLTAALPPQGYAPGVLDLLAETLGTTGEEPVPGLRTYSQGGYSTFREGRGPDEILWVMDHAPLGMGWLAAHAHADTLAVYLHVGGRPLLVDAGTYLYHSAGAWRDRLRSTAEHNTVELGGTDSSLMAGPFNWRRSPRATGTLVSTGATVRGLEVEALHEGYVERLGLVHRRRLIATGRRSYALEDQVDGPPGADFRWSLLVAPDHDVARTGEGWAIRRDDREVAVLRVPERWRSCMREEAAWCSPAFGRLEPATRLVLEGTTTSSTAISLEVVLAGVGRPAGPPPPRSSRLAPLLEGPVAAVPEH